MENERYYQGKFDQISQDMARLEENLSAWKIAFGWALAGIIILGIIGFIAIASSGSITGYTPEQVADISIKICEALR